MGINPKADEKKKAAFITEYKALCERFEMIVCHDCGDEEYAAFFVGCVDEDPRMIEISCTEMLIEDMKFIIHED